MSLSTLLIDHRPGLQTRTAAEIAQRLVELSVLVQLPGCEYPLDGNELLALVRSGKFRELTGLDRDLWAFLDDVAIPANEGQVVPLGESALYEPKKATELAERYGLTDGVAGSYDRAIEPRPEAFGWQGPRSIMDAAFVKVAVDLRVAKATARHSWQDAVSAIDPTRLANLDAAGLGRALHDQHPATFFRLLDGGAGDARVRAGLLDQRPKKASVEQWTVFVDRVMDGLLAAEKQGSAMLHGWASSGLTDENADAAARALRRVDSRHADVFDGAVLAVAQLDPELQASLMRFLETAHEKDVTALLDVLKTSSHAARSFIIGYLVVTPESEQRALVGFLSEYVADPRLKDVDRAFLLSRFQAGAITFAPEMIFAMVTSSEWPKAKKAFVSFVQRVESGSEQAMQVLVAAKLTFPDDAVAQLQFVTTH